MAEVQDFELLKTVDEPLIETAPNRPSWLWLVVAALVVATAAAATRSVIDRATGTQREQLKIARTELDGESSRLRRLADKDLKELEQLLDKVGAPWTPGRLPVGKEK